MFVGNAIVKNVKMLQENVYLLSFLKPSDEMEVTPGQFFNIKVCESCYPLLRRPFSICDAEGDTYSLLFSVYGEGTKMLADKREGDKINILGPLGNGFNINGDYNTAVIVAGGLGSAPFPLLTRKIENSKKIISFVGAKNDKSVITYGMKNIQIATDDGSEGYKGNVVDLFKNKLNELSGENIKVFACGPNIMLSALKKLCIENNILCELSTECAMACGFGICQGCPIESSDREKYYLVCKDGPVFNAEDIYI